MPKTSFVLDEELLQRKEYLKQNGYDVYCLNTFLSKEMDLCGELNKNYESLLALPIYTKSYKSVNGVKSVIDKPLLSNYIFVYLDKNEHIYNIKSNNTLYKVLDKHMEEGKLYGQDLEYANFIFENNGVIPLSQALKVGSKVQIVSGPLKELEAYIVKYDTRNKGVKVRLHIMNREIESYLPYEYISVKI